MTSFRIISDIHLEFNGKFSLKGLPKTDYLILGGDITTRKTIDTFISFIDDIKEDYKSIIYILGNHEHYGDEKIEYNETIEFYKQLCLDIGILFLNNDWIEIEGLRIFGATLWTDINIVSYLSIRDKHFVNHSEILKQHKLTKEIISNNEKFDIIITHHLPSYELIAERYKHFKSNSGFASNLDKELLQKTRYWIYGHTHIPSIKEINDTTFICNPLGYPNENKFSDYVLNIEKSCQ